MAVLWVLSYLMCVAFFADGRNVKMSGFHEKKSQESMNIPFEWRSNMLQVAREFILDHPEIIPSINAMLNEIQHELPWTSEYVLDLDGFICPEYGQYPCEVSPTEGNSMLTDTWRHLLDSIGNDWNECDACLSFWQAMKNLACTGVDWPTMRDTVIRWCINNLPLLPVVCNGTISTQGKHVYCILLQADTRHFCESMNNCYPPDNRTDRPPVSERTPWAVRDKLVSEGRWPRQKGNRADTRRPEDEKYVKIAALTDIHVQMNHAQGSPTECQADVCCLEEFPGNGSARYWGEYTCNLPFHTLELFLERVRGIEPDFVIFAGDIPPHTMWDETETSQLNCSELIVEAMTKTFGPDLRVYPAIGNHEMYPTNLFSTYLNETRRMIKRFTEIWSKPAGFDLASNKTFSQMSYYTILVPSHDRLRIVTINTEFDWYTLNFYNTLNEPIPENEEHKEWLNNTLRKAREDNEKVIIISHHPVGGWDGHVRSARWWEAIINEYNDVISLHVSGHTHLDELKLIFDPYTMEAVGVNHIAPTANTKNYVNPSLVMYYLDADNYTLVDYESFYLDIKEQDQSIGVPPAIVFSYSSRSEYDMLDLSPESYKDLILRFLEDDSLFQKYHRNKNSRALSDEYCNYTCKVVDVCNMWFVEKNEAIECMKYAPEEVSTVSPATTSDYVNTSKAVFLSALAAWTCVILSCLFGQSL